MEAHIVSPRVYVIVFAVLLILTLVTIQVSFLDLGPLNTVVALTIAVSKALAVTLYFMHVRYSTGLTQIVVIGGLLWLGILITFVMADYLTRDWFPVPTWGNWELTPQLPDWWGN